jgi:hypothetical protein
MTNFIEKGKVRAFREASMHKYIRYEDHKVVIGTKERVIENSLVRE